MFEGEVEIDGVSVKRFECMEKEQQKKEPTWSIPLRGGESN